MSMPLHIDSPSSLTRPVSTGPFPMETIFPGKNSGKKEQDTGTSWVATNGNLQHISGIYILRETTSLAWKGPGSCTDMKKKEVSKVSRISSEAPSRSSVQIWNKEEVSKGLQDKPGRACCPMFNLTMAKRVGEQGYAPWRPKQQSQNQKDCCPLRWHSCHLLYLLLILSFFLIKDIHTHTVTTLTLYMQRAGNFF